MTTPYICIVLQKQPFSVLEGNNGMLHKPGSGLSHSLICFFHLSNCSFHVIHTIIIIIIIIISHTLGLDRPVTPSSKDLPSHLRPFGLQFSIISAIPVLSILVACRKKLNSVALVHKRTIPTERPPPVGEVSANFCG